MPTTHQGPLLTTKLMQPPAPPEVVPRPRLLAQLDRSARGRITLITAAAGYGKTTLLSQWLAGRREPVAWLSLDGPDDSPARFWSYLLRALEGLIADDQDNLSELLKGLAAETAGEAELTRLVNAVGQLPRASLLVLDDYHVITDPGIHQAMSFLVEHLPASLHLLITSRDTPPLPLARLRVRRQLGEVGAEDLRFTPDEAAAFLADVMGLELDAETLAALESRTEGWAASLQLAALSLQGRDDARERIAAFSGGDAYLYDYLADEVLNRQPPEIQQFLLKTSILERFDDVLSGALLGVGEVDSAPGPQLAEVARANLFLTPLDAERRWYRYHPLFAEFLRRRLEQLRPEWVQELHVRASEWYESEGFSDEAVRHVLAGGEIERAVQLVESHSRAVMWQRGDYPTLRRWLEALPDEVVLARPRLSLDSAWLGLVGHRERDVPILAHVERLLGDRSDPEAQSMRGEIAILQAEYAIAHGLVTDALAQLETARTLLPAEEKLLRGFNAQSHGYALRVRGDVAAASEALEEATLLCREVGNLPGAVAALSDLAEVRKLQGRFDEARSLFERSITMAREGPGTGAVTACAALVGLAELQLERGELTAARASLDEGFELSRQAGYSSVEIYAELIEARLQQALGDEAASRTALARAQELAADIGNDWRRSQVTANCVGVWLQQGDVAAAGRWARLQDRAAELPPEDLGQHELERLALARVYLAEGRSDDALAILEAQRQAAEAAGRTRRQVEAHALSALARQQRGDEAAALSQLERALSLAAPEGLVRTFLDLGDPMLALLRTALAQRTVPHYAASLLRAFRHRDAGTEADTPGLLTDRELEILRLVADGFSNQEIAERLIRSIGTIKVHTSNIYGKLGVRGRTEAVARARELALLE